LFELKPDKEDIASFTAKLQKSSTVSEVFMNYPDDLALDYLADIEE
jgi:hypothetical protein